MAGAIFLSAGVPDPKVAPMYAKTADTVAINAAVSGLMYVILGRRQLIWGGQPGITPMIWIAAESHNIDYSSWVKLYQSQFFEEQFPEDNQRFQNVTYVPSVNNNREESLLEMRARMFAENPFDAAIFIGGMQGIIDEYHLFSELQPQALKVPVYSAGGAALEIKSDVAEAVSDDLDYVALFHKILKISPLENRYASPADQPTDPKNRLWKAPTRQ